MEQRHDEQRKTVPDELFEGMMDRGTHSLLLAASKRTNRTVVAFYGYMLPCNSREMVQSTRNNADARHRYFMSSGSKRNGESQQLLTSDGLTMEFEGCVNA